MAPNLKMPEPKYAEPQLKYMPVLYIFVAGVLPYVLLSPYFDGTHVWACVAAGITAGVAGLLQQYRSDFGPLAHIGMTLLIALLVVTITLGAIGIGFTIVIGAPELASRGGLYTAVALALVGLLGMGRGWRMTRGKREDWLEQRVDLDKQVMRHAPPPPVSRWQNLVLALGVSSPTLLEMLGIGRYSLLLLLIPPLLMLSTYTMLRSGYEITLLWQIRRYEKRHGLRFTSVHREAFRRQRQAFPLARWLCRAEDVELPQ